MRDCVSKEIARRWPLLLPCRLSLAGQCNNEFFDLKIDSFSAGLRGTIAAARPVTPIGMLDFNSDPLLLR